MTIQAHKAIEAALVQRGIPVRQKCPCCDWPTASSDFAKAGEFVHEAALIERYGMLPCFECANSHHVCYQCPSVTIDTDDEYSTNEFMGDHFCSTECRDIYEDSAR